MRNYILNF